MNCYRVSILDENQKLLISKIVTDDEGSKEIIAGRIQVIIDLHHAPFTVSVTDYIHDTRNVFEFMTYLHTALTEMSLRGPSDRIAMTEDWP